MIDSIFDWSEYPLKPENGEVEQGLLCYKTDGVPYNAIVFFDENKKVVRLERILPADSIIDNILNSF